MNVLLGKKLGMTQIFDEAGRARGVTAVQVWPSEVLRVKTVDSDGYEAMVLGSGDGEKAVRNIGKAVLGQSKGAKHSKDKSYSLLAEFPVAEGAEVGTVLGIDQVEVGESVDVTAVSKGKGFQGTIKRHNFSRGPMTHGSRNQRRPGSIGGVDAARVFPGQKMPGRMGAERVTTKRVAVAAVHADDQIVLLHGSVPGPRGATVTLRSAK